MRGMVFVSFSILFLSVLVIDSVLSGLPDKDCAPLPLVRGYDDGTVPGISLSVISLCFFFCAYGVRFPEIFSSGVHFVRGLQFSRQRPLANGHSGL